MFNIVSLICLLGTFLFIKEPPLQIICASIATILFIVMGEKFRLEEKWESLNIPGREAFLPILVLCIFFIRGVVDPSLITEVVSEKAPILALILSFAVISNGLAKCGFFEFAAYKAVEKCGGDTRRLILYIFIIASVITLFTSNDIVILTLTPIIYAICLNARIKNGKLLFLAQFVAANTLAMGLMIGSPTNIIVAQDFGISFIEYSMLMIVPAIFSLLLSIIVIDFINRKSNSSEGNTSLFSRLNWQYSESYRVPARAPWSEFTRRMSRWIILFGLAVLLLIIATNQSSENSALYWVAVPLTLASAVLMIAEVIFDETYVEKTNIERAKEVSSTILQLPYGIIFFAITFFVFSKYISNSGLLADFVSQYLQFSNSHPLYAGPLTVFGSGISVNVLNDLPAAALMSETLQCDLYPHLIECGGVAIEDTQLKFTRNVIVSSMMVGLNIGCYLTPVGALAGLIWFSQMRSEERRQRTFHNERMKDPRLAATLGEFEPVQLPTRRDLVVYGFLNFFFVGFFLGLFIPFSAFILQILTYPAADLSNVFETIKIPGLGWTTACGLIVITYIFLKTKQVIEKNQVALSHMSEIFTMLNGLIIWSYRHRFLYILLVFLAFLTLSCVLLYWAEVTTFKDFAEVHKRLNPEGGNKLDTTHPINIITWFFVFFGSSNSQFVFPSSLLGQFLAGLVPLSAIAAMLFVVRNTSNATMNTLRKALGLGKIPNQRIIIVNHQTKFEDAVVRMLTKKSAFVVLLCKEDHLDRAEAFTGELLNKRGLANRTLVHKVSADPYATLKEFDFSSASEIYFLTDLTATTDVDNLRMLTRIDAWLNSKRLAAADDLAENDYSQESDDVEVQLKSFGDFVGIPKIYFEASSKRQLKRVKSALSDLTRYHTHYTSFDDVVAEQMISDIFGDLNQLNKRLKFGELLPSKDIAESMFSGGAAPFKNYKLVDREISGESLKSIRGLFKEHVEKEGALGRSLKNHSVETRIKMQDLLGAIDILAPENSSKDSIDSIIGLQVKLHKRFVRMTTANAAVSSQAVTTNGIVELKRYSDSQPSNNIKISDRNEKKQIFIFNFNPYADTLIHEILKLKETRTIEIIILVAEHINIPDDIFHSTSVKVFRRKTIDDAIGLMLPSSDSVDDDKDRVRPASFQNFAGISEGSSIIVFTDYEDEHRSNVDTVQFIEGLDSRLTSVEGSIGSRIHGNLFVAAECNNEETRFLFEHLAVDKIIDTSRLRRSFLEHLAETYHAFPARMKDSEFSGVLGEARWGQFHSTMFNFRRSLKYAEYFKSFIVRTADTFEVIDAAGISKSVIGMKCKEVHDLLERYSEPPFFLVSVTKLAPKKYSMSTEHEFGSGPYMETMPFDLDYQIKKNDCLILCSLI